MSHRAAVGRKQRKRLTRASGRGPRVIIRDRQVIEVKNIPMDRDATLVTDSVDLVYYALSCIGVEPQDMSALFRVHEYGVAERIKAGAALAERIGLDFERYKGLLRREADPHQEPAQQV